MTEKFPNTLTKCIIKTSKKPTGRPLIKKNGWKTESDIFKALRGKRHTAEGTAGRPRTDLSTDRRKGRRPWNERKENNSQPGVLFPEKIALQSKDISNQMKAKGCITSTGFEKKH